MKKQEAEREFGKYESMLGSCIKCGELKWEECGCSGKVKKPNKRPIETPVTTDYRVTHERKNSKSYNYVTDANGFVICNPSTENYGDQIAKCINDHEALIAERDALRGRVGELKTIYRCGWCGMPKDREGKFLPFITGESNARSYVEHFTKQGFETKKVNGECCPNGN